MKPAAAEAPKARLTAAKRTPAPAPKISKDELRAQVEKLERSNATLRTKGRETGRAAKAATARIEELEQQVARLEKRAAAARPKSAAPEASPARGGRRRRAPDEGDAGLALVAAEAPKTRRRKAKDAPARMEDAEAAPEHERDDDDDVVA